MRVLIISTIFILVQGCSSLGFVNEDAGLSMLASDVSVPANGRVIYTVDRQPRTDYEARAWAREAGVSRSYLSWFGITGAKKSETAGSAQNHLTK